MRNELMAPEIAEEDPNSYELIRVARDGFSADVANMTIVCITLQALQLCHKKSVTKLKRFHPFLH
ncbi:MAG: hypothetical protein ACXVKH_15710 [Candidatus Angelobacter sp.]